MPCVEELMTREVVTVPSDTNVQKAAEIMAERHVGCLIITENGLPKGIITERDFLTKILAPKRQPLSLTVSEIMSSPLITVGPRDQVRDAARVMIENNIRRLVVVENTRLLGVITLRDITRSIVGAMASYARERISVKEKGTVIEYHT